MPDAWPGLLRGEALVKQMAGANIPIAGFIDAAEAEPDIELAPLLWCSAEPCAHVTDDAFEWIAAMIVDGIAKAGDLDGIYLDLHGAMVVESFADGEGELLSRIRKRVGEAMPIVVSLDLHANITPAMVRHASCLLIYRTYPHLDMADTGTRGVAILNRLLAGETLHKAFRQVPFLIPLPAQYTGTGVGAALYALLPESQQRVISADIAMGFPLADIYHAGASIVAYAFSRKAAEAEVERLLGAFVAAEASFDSALIAAKDAVAIALAAQSDKPVVLADVQDNAGAGATSDTTGLLQAMVDGGAHDAVLALLCDPVMAQKAHAAGVGAIIAGPLGNRSGALKQPRFNATFSVEALSDGQFAFTGLMNRGGIAELGPAALLRVLARDAAVRVIISTKRCQCLDLAVFTHIGIDPTKLRLIGVKSSVHFRADFAPIASRIINTEAPGLSNCRTERIAYRHLRPGVRTAPLGAPFTGYQHRPVKLPLKPHRQT